MIVSLESKIDILNIHEGPYIFFKVNMIYDIMFVNNSSCIWDFKEIIHLFGLKHWFFKIIFDGNK